MECWNCEYREGTLEVMFMFDSMPSYLCVACESESTIPHRIVAEADTRN